MTVVLELPSDIEKVLRASGTDPSRAAKESLLVELYRQRQITHHQLGQALDLNAPAHWPIDLGPYSLPHLSVTASKSSL